MVVKMLPALCLFVLCLSSFANAQPISTLPWPDKEIHPELKAWLFDKLWQDYDITSLMLTQVEKSSSYGDINQSLSASGGRLELYKITALYSACLLYTSDAADD